MIKDIPKLTAVYSKSCKNYTKSSCNYKKRGVTFIRFSALGWLCWREIIELFEWELSTLILSLNEPWPKLYLQDLSILHKLTQQTFAYTSHINEILQNIFAQFSFIVYGFWTMNTLCHWPIVWLIAHTRKLTYWILGSFDFNFVVLKISSLFTFSFITIL